MFTRGPGPPYCGFCHSGRFGRARRSSHSNNGINVSLTDAPTMYDTLHRPPIRYRCPTADPTSPKCFDASQHSPARYGSYPSPITIGQTPNPAASSDTHTSIPQDLGEAGSINGGKKRAGSSFARASNAIIIYGKYRTYHLTKPQRLTDRPLHQQFHHVVAITPTTILHPRHHRRLASHASADIRLRHVSSPSWSRKRTAPTLLCLHIVRIRVS